MAFLVDDWDGCPRDSESPSGCDTCRQIRRDLVDNPLPATTRRFSTSPDSCTTVADLTVGDDSFRCRPSRG